MQFISLGGSILSAIQQYVLFGTALTPTEIALLRVDDYLKANGKVKDESVISGEIAYNQNEHPLFWVNKRVVESIDKYLEERKKLKQGISAHDWYRGLALDSPLFLTENGTSICSGVVRFATQ